MALRWGWARGYKGLSRAAVWEVCEGESASRVSHTGVCVFRNEKRISLLGFVILLPVPLPLLLCIF